MLLGLALVAGCTQTPGHPPASSTTTVFTALASGAGTTACSAPFEFVNPLTPPNGFEHEPNGTVADANAVSVEVGQPADIEGHLDGSVGPYNSDNFTLEVTAGRSIRVETFDWTGAACELIDPTVNP